MKVTRLGEDVLTLLTQDPCMAEGKEILSLIAEVRAWRSLMFSHQGKRITLEKLAIGGLKHAINTHGPVTREWIGSAAKRIVHQIKAHVKSEILSWDGGEPKSPVDH